MHSFEGKTVVVTGGASGIGRASALLFAKHGANLVIGDVSPAGEEVAAEITRTGGHTVFLKTDITRAEDCHALVALAVEHFGRLDCAANIAGMAGGADGIFGSIEERNQTIAVNLFGTFNSVVAEAAVMKQARAGAIVNVSSIAGIQGSGHGAYYVAAKHGVIGFTKSAALELAQDNIRVNAICPGFTQTPMTVGHFGDNVAAIAASHTPLGRIGTPEDQAAAIVWLCSDEAAFVTGAVLAVDGALSAGPKTYRRELS